MEAALRRVLQARGLQPRPGITVDDIASILSACSGGVALCTLGDPSSEVIDHDRQRSIPGTAALAVIYACLERTEDASGLTLERAVRSLVNDRPEARHSPAN
jgi:hypothetical protein